MGSHTELARTVAEVACSACTPCTPCNPSPRCASPLKVHHGHQRLLFIAGKAARHITIHTPPCSCCGCGRAPGRSGGCSQQVPPAQRRHQRGPFPWPPAPSPRYSSSPQLPTTAPTWKDQKWCRMASAAQAPAGSPLQGQGRAVGMPCAATPATLFTIMRHSTSSCWFFRGANALRIHMHTNARQWQPFNKAGTKGKSLQTARGKGEQEVQEVQRTASCSDVTSGVCPGHVRFVRMAPLLALTLSRWVRTTRAAPPAAMRPSSAMQKHPIANWDSTVHGPRSTFQQRRSG